MVRRSSSSISSSENPIEPIEAHGLTPRRVVAACALALFGLVGADMALDRLFAMPTSPLKMPTALQQYFDYGRSVEGKLRRMVGAGTDDTALVANAGWLDEQVVKSRNLPQGAVRVAVYGQSFAMQIVQALERQDSRFQVVAERAGPSAPLSHSYAAYRAESGPRHADIVVFGVLASSLPRLVSLTNTTSWFESPTPFTYPRYRLENGRLIGIEPRVSTLNELRRALKEPVAWHAFVEQLRHDDLAFDPLLFNADIMDASSLGRLLRRGYGQRHMQQVEQRYHQRTGFTNRDGLLDITKAMVSDIVRIAAERGQLPCILLIHDRGYDNHLATALSDLLDAQQIPYLSSHSVALVSDARNFLTDGHFTGEVNEKLAKALRDVLRTHVTAGSDQFK